MTAMLGAVAPLAVLLEGGYNLRATAAGCEATLRVLLGQSAPRFPKAVVPSTPALLALQQVVRVQVCVLRFPSYWLQRTVVQIPSYLLLGRSVPTLYCSDAHCMWLCVGIPL
jgi:hypothetical protein